MMAHFILETMISKPARSKAWAIFVVAPDGYQLVGRHAVRPVSTLVSQAQTGSGRAGQYIAGGRFVRGLLSLARRCLTGHCLLGC